MLFANIFEVIFRADCLLVRGLKLGRGKRERVERDDVRRDAVVQRSKKDAIIEEL